MNHVKLRKLAMCLLDDDEGISTDAWISLAEFLDTPDNRDIISMISGSENRCYLPTNHNLPLEKQEYDD